MRIFIAVLGVILAAATLFAEFYRIVDLASLLALPAKAWRATTTEFFAACLRSAGLAFHGYWTATVLLPLTLLAAAADVGLQLDVIAVGGALSLNGLRTQITLPGLNRLLAVVVVAVAGLFLFNAIGLALGLPAVRSPRPISMF